jgi:hypothetical protein
MLKLQHILTEGKVTPVDRKMVNVLQRIGVDPDEISEIWDKLNDPLYIKDIDLKVRISFLYSESCWEDEDGEIVCNDLNDVDWDKMTDISGIDHTLLALSKFLEIQPFLIEELKYKHYGLIVYTNISENEEYIVGTEYEADEAMHQYADEMITHNLDDMQDYWLEQFITLDSWSVDQFCEEDADYRIEDMSDEEIMEEIGLEPEEKQDDIDTWETEKEEKEEALVDMEDELNELDEQRDEIEQDYGDDSDEYSEADKEHGEKEYDVHNLEADIEELKDNIKIAQQELDNMPEEAKTELHEKYVDSMRDNIEYEGVEYFTDNLGMSRQDAIDGYFVFDKEGAIDQLANETDRGDALSAYDGVEEEQLFDDESYYIYRIG